ncbi:hypothetical protein GE21DRAFT_5281 [Neurospora crassa]|uniref:Uncharacterized protein n=1 Tax=Neurospora crassa (strain ATCC 24698 / 74-OR23-1A / CBS 708.71 / DSM 1257 / FGSC 987) TaxID=367110 RepID=Q7SAU6_NEUCR|nr:hypothetical protein NCU07644 [Neurospora crassa OR74A]EAA33516.3 hypothetical protein NCU07644 [Neurospora crassa OR74A]KHE78667.1 hypothetical protein GE21DRAFT_5281 [Neurospora crassa]|eukprot:XP_962752.3 hypothetical protein NCU07644 [Neurospora crassa OR74A]
MSSNAQLPRQRYIQSMDDYWRLEMEALMSPNSGGGTAADIPTTDEERFRLVDQMVAAFRNTDNICDSRADTHGHIRFVEEELTDKSAERMAWKLLLHPVNSSNASTLQAETQACEGSEGDFLSNPATRIARAQFKDFTTRWRVIVAVFACCKAAVSNLFQPSIVERFVNNPITELDIKAHNAKIAAAVKEHGSAAFDRETGVLRDSDGTVLDVLLRPQKRRLADVLPPDLIPHAKVKRVRRSRRQAQTPANNQDNAHDDPNGDNDSNGGNDPSGANQHQSDNESQFDNEYGSENDYDQSDSEYNGAGDAQSGNQLEEQAATPSAHQFHDASDYSVHVHEQHFISRMIDHEVAHAVEMASSSSHQSEHHDQEVHGGQLPAFDPAWSEDYGLQPAGNAQGTGLEGFLPSGLNPIVPHHSSPHLIAPLHSSPPPISLYQESPPDYSLYPNSPYHSSLHHNYPHPTVTHPNHQYGRQTTPATRSANGAHHTHNHPGNQTFTLHSVVTPTFKAAVYNIAQPNYLESFVNIPATKLDTKLSNLYTNAAKATRQKIATAVEKYGSASFHKTTRELKDSQGDVIAVYPKPVKRKLADVLGPELAGHAKVKRARRPRQARTQASNADYGSNANNPNSLYEKYGEDGNNDTDVDDDNNDHGNDDIHYGNQVRGSAGVDSSNQSQHHDDRVHGGIDRQGHIPNSLPFNIAQPNALYPSLPRQSSHLSNLNNPHPNTIQTNALYSDLPHYNSPLPNSQHYTQQSAPAAGSQNGQHLDYVYLSNGHFVLEEDDRYPRVKLPVYDYGYGDYLYDSKVVDNDRDGDYHSYGNQSNAERESANGGQEIDTSVSSSFHSQDLDLNHQLGSKSSGHAGVGPSVQHHHQHQDFYAAMDYQNSMANHQANSLAHYDFAEDFIPQHHGNQVGGPAGVGSSSQFHHHGYRGYAAQFPVAGQVHNQEFGVHHSYVGGGFEGPLSTP